LKSTIPPCAVQETPAVSAFIELAMSPAGQPASCAGVRSDRSRSGRQQALVQFTLTSADLRHTELGTAAMQAEQGASIRPSWKIVRAGVDSAIAGRIASAHEELAGAYRCRAQDTTSARSAAGWKKLRILTARAGQFE
jgi:hypothetical protein